MLVSNVTFVFREHSLNHTAIRAYLYYIMVLICDHPGYTYIVYVYYIFVIWYTYTDYIQGYTGKVLILHRM